MRLFSFAFISIFKNIYIGMIKLKSIINEILEQYIPYGGWLDKNAKFYVVKEYQNHIEFALDYCKQHGIEFGNLLPDVGIVYAPLYNDGFIRVVFDTHNEPVLNYCYKREIPPSTKQLKELRDIAIEFRIKFIHDDTTNRTDNIDESVIKSLISKKYIYHGTYDGAAYSIQRDRKMKLNAASNDEPFISFTSNINVAKYYAMMKGGKSNGVILRTKLTSDFALSDKFIKNNGYELVTKTEIPISEIEIYKNNTWTPLANYDFIKK